MPHPAQSPSLATAAKETPRQAPLPGCAPTGTPQMPRRRSSPHLPTGHPRTTCLHNATAQAIPSFYAAIRPTRPDRRPNDGAPEPIRPRHPGSAHQALAPLLDRNHHARQNHHGRSVCRRGRRNRIHLPPPRRQRRWLRPGRTQRGPLALGVRVRHLVLQRRYLRGLRRPIRVEIRPSCHLGGHWKRHFGKPACLVGARSAHARDDATPARLHHAGILRQALLEPSPAHRGSGHHLRVPHPLHRQRLQRPFAPVRHGVRVALRSVRHRNGTCDLHLRCHRRLHGHRSE